MSAYEIEKRNCLENEAMSQGEFMSAAINQYASAYGIEDTECEWILTPFDTWELNPHYIGAPGRHPEDEPDRDEDGNYIED